MTITTAKASQSLLILKSDTNTMTSTETFLRNRGWEVYSTSDVKNALIQVVSKEYDYILISVDHENKKVLSLPKLIQEKFDVTIISFAESTSAKSFNNLTSSPTVYKIYAPITGPAVERCINKCTKAQGTPGKLREKQSDSYRLPAFLKANNDVSGVYISGKSKTNPGLGTVHMLNENMSPHQQRLQELRKLNSTNDTLIARATQTSLIGNVEILDGNIIDNVSMTVHPTCIFIDSKRFSGYLVAVLGNDEAIEESFIKNIQKALFKFLKDNDEPVTETDISRLHIKQVEFEPWALEYADFLKTAAHLGRELALAFFSTKPLIPYLDKSKHSDMIKIQLQDLKGDCKVEFNLYIYLEINNKFVLYTPNGGFFYQKQIDRLKKQGITHLHLQKESVPALAKYKAQNYLNSLIDSYEEKKKALFETEVA